MTILRDQRTTRGDFIFYADRLSTLIVEKALELIPHCPKKIQTPLKVDFEGVTQTNDVRYVSSLVDTILIYRLWLEYRFCDPAVHSHMVYDGSFGMSRLELCLSSLIPKLENRCC